MNVNLRELYQDLRERRPLSQDALRPGMRIGVIYPDSIHIITIAATGPGMIENDYVGQQLIDNFDYLSKFVKVVLENFEQKSNMSGYSKFSIAMASISTGQPALKWEPDGTVHLMKPQQVVLRAPWQINAQKPLNKRQLG